VKQKVQVVKRKDGVEFIYSPGRCQNAGCRECYPNGVMKITKEEDASISSNR
jgi:hypothetical protein